MKSLAGQIVLVTGAGGGYGQAMTRQFLRHGCLLVLADLRRGPLVRATEQAIARLRGGQPPGRILGFVEANLATEAGADELHRQCLSLAPAPDILVNNAGVAVFGPLWDVPPDRWEQVVQVDLLAPMRLCARFLPAMIARRQGHIVNVSSAAGLVGAAGLSAYCAAKFGLRGFGEALQLDLRRYGIDVTTVYPFFSRTPILDSEQWGAAPARKLPQALLYDPDFVVAALIDGIRRRQQHVYPGTIPRQIDLLRRLAPAALDWINRATS